MGHVRLSRGLDAQLVQTLAGEIRDFGAAAIGLHCSFYFWWSAGWSQNKIFNNRISHMLSLLMSIHRVVHARVSTLRGKQCVLSSL